LDLWHWGCQTGRHFSCENDLTLDIPPPSTQTQICCLGELKYKTPITIVIMILCEMVKKKFSYILLSTLTVEIEKKKENFYTAWNKSLIYTYLIYCIPYEQKNKKKQDCDTPIIHLRTLYTQNNIIFFYTNSKKKNRIGALILILTII